MTGRLRDSSKLDRQAAIIADISKNDPNVHAGVKYVRQVIDRYFADESMADLNKGLFAFAAYNAGPVRVGQPRQRAAVVTLG